MKSHKNSILVIAFALLNFASLPIHAQMRNFNTRTYTPAPSRPVQIPSAPARSSPPTQRQTSSQSNSAAQHQSSPSNSAPQRRTQPATPQRSEPSYLAPSRTAPSRPSNEPNRTQSSSNNSAKQSHAQEQQERARQQQQKEQARQQKEAQKQQEKQKKEQARQQKEEQKRLQKQQKEQARQQKEALKQQQKQLKEQARAQKNSSKPANEQMQHSDAQKSSNYTSHPAQAHTPSAYHVPAGSALGKTASGSRLLTREGSHAVIQQVNSARLQMSGINRKAIPEGNVTVHGNGRLTVNTASGRQYGVRPDGTISSYRDSTKTVSFTHGGKVSSLHTSNLDIRHSANGQRTVISKRSDNTRLITTGAHSGYVERNVVVGNQTYIQRTTVINNRIVTNHYVGFAYGGVAMTRFVTPAFYAPAFYGWAFYPWVRPVYFTFGWFGAPWYIGPNPYFAAYPAYPGAAFWLTDYAIGETLSTAYQMHADAELADAADYAADADDSMIADADDEESGDTVSAVATTPITPELKANIVEEVKQELSYDNAASKAKTQQTGYDEVTSVLTSPHHVFLVSTDLEVTTVDEQACSLQAGDILQVEAQPVQGSTLAELRVASSKRTDCPAGVTVTVAVSDLQEMHNNFRAQVESGLGKLQAEQGHNGIPAVPPAALAAPSQRTLVGVETLPPDQVNAMLDTERSLANQAEAGVTPEAF